MSDSKQSSSDQSDSVLLVERDGAVAVVTLNRPEQRNALSAELRIAIGSTMAELEADPDIRAVVVTGAGSAFCAGMDLKEIGGGGDGKTGYELSVAGQDELRAGFENFSGPVIAAVNGAAATAGFELALACDIIFVAKGAKFLDTHARVGIVPGWGLSQRLPRIIGINRAKEVSLSGNALTAERACDWGLANRVCEPATLVDEAKALAKDICSCVPGVMEQVKTMIDTGYSMHFDDAMAYELETGIESSKAIDSSKIGERRAAIMERGRDQ
jgi:enoyl-CoA hydratase